MNSTAIHPYASILISRLLVVSGFAVSSNEHQRLSGVMIISVPLHRWRLAVSVMTSLLACISHHDSRSIVVVDPVRSSSDLAVRKSSNYSEGFVCLRHSANGQIYYFA